MRGISCQRRPGARLCKGATGPAFPKSKPRILTRCKATQDQESTQPQAEVKEEYDVYLAGPQPLQEGIEKHTLSVFVADEAGIINRVAGVFARRGMNIESLAVGLNINKALFTITVNGMRSQVATMVKQLTKLVKVRYVEDVSKTDRLDREMALFKISVPHGVARSEVLELTSIFKGKIVDVGPESVTINLSGDPGKLYAFEKLVMPFGLVQLTRTGRISLQKSDSNVTVAALQAFPSVAPSPAAGRAMPPAEAGHADVYMVDQNPAPGPWTVPTILDAEYDTEGSIDAFAPHTILIEVMDEPGVLNQVTGVVARRGYNIQSLAVGNSEKPGLSRITTVIPGQRSSVDKLLKQVERLVVVQSVSDVTSVPHVARELMLIKVQATAAQRSEVKDVVEILHGRVEHMTAQSMTAEIIGTEDRIQAAQKLLQQYGVLEVARTGRVAMERGSRVDSVLLQSSQLGRHV